MSIDDTFPSPGWYPDPSSESGVERFWDGERWTDNVRSNHIDRPRVRGQSPWIEEKPSPWGRVLIIVGGCLAVVAGAFVLFVIMFVTAMSQFGNNK